MSTTTQDREQSHPAARAAHNVLDAINLVQAAPWLHGSDPLGQALGAFEQIAELLGEIAQDVAALHCDREAKAAELAEQRAEMCDFARTIAELEAAAIAMEQLDTKRVGTISELRTRLGVEQREREMFHAELADALGDLARLVTYSDRLRKQMQHAEQSPLHGAPRIAASH